MAVLFSCMVETSSKLESNSGNGLFIVSGKKYERIPAATDPIPNTTYGTAVGVPSYLKKKNNSG